MDTKSSNPQQLLSLDLSEGELAYRTLTWDADAPRSVALAESLRQASSLAQSTKSWPRRLHVIATQGQIEQATQEISNEIRTAADTQAYVDALEGVVKACKAFDACDVSRYEALRMAVAYGVGQRNITLRL